MLHLLTNYWEGIIDSWFSLGGNHHYIVSVDKWYENME